jgi:hypothetical protein
VAFEISSESEEFYMVRVSKQIPTTGNLIRKNGKEKLNVSCA